MKRIKTIQQARKYIDKIIYYVDADKTKPTKLYIGGVNLFYNRIDYTVIGFTVYQDKGCKNCWGDIKSEEIETKFEEDKRHHMVYVFSLELANHYLSYLKADRKEWDKRMAIKGAKQLLDEHKINYEIFD